MVHFVGNIGPKALFLNNSWGSINIFSAFTVVS